MENYSTNRPHKKKNGSCPYCEGNVYGTFEESHRIDSRTVIQQHVGSPSCGKFSLLRENNNHRFPLQDPTDENSSAYI